MPPPRTTFKLPASHRSVLTATHRTLALTHAKSLLETPTAPYAEDGQLATLRAFASSHPNFTLREDRYSNLLITWNGKQKHTTPHLAFSAHLDHPGFLHETNTTFSFHGGVPDRYLPGAKLRIFDLATRQPHATARIASIEKREHTTLCRLTAINGDIPTHAFAMWDLTPGAIRGTRLHARVCDDLLGAAAILTTLTLAAESNLATSLTGIFTRAEETGFVGCQGLLRSNALPKNLAVIGLECSPKRATAKVGLGPVIRVGDKLSVFSPRITHLLQDVAADLHAANPAFIHQRALMDGGSCESTAYNHFGVEAGALCLALGNYHNCGPKNRIAPEYVDWNDHESLIALLFATAKAWSRARPSKISVRLNRIWRDEYKRLASSARRQGASTRSASASKSRTTRRVR